MVAEAREGLLAFHGAAPMRLAMPEDPEQLGGAPEAPVPGAPPPPRPRPRHWRELKHLPAALLIIAGLWVLTQSVLATAAAAVVILGGLGLLVARGPRGA
ncbi:hypothetical protein [Roseomonas sp. USHLN139]|uniref:hypothetical protein n=1 Tax=Roseomonas sp. USHLN139 TaxID=3081298 RepID=UPI003B028A0E